MVSTISLVALGCASWRIWAAKLACCCSLLIRFVNVSANSVPNSFSRSKIAACLLAMACAFLVW